MKELKSNSGVQRKCHDCGGKMFGRKENYTYSECGLTSVILLGIVVYHCKCGAIVPEIPAPGNLHLSIAMDVLKKKTLLSGDEVRFIRKVAGYSATELARVIGMANTSVSHWETKSKRIGKEADRLVRLSCFARIIEKMLGTNGAAEMIERVARVTKGLNLTAVLEQLEDRFEGAKPVKISPDISSGMDFYDLAISSSAVQ